jgi:hypothetical protein
MKSLDRHQEYLLLHHCHLCNFSILLQLELEQDNARHQVLKSIQVILNYEKVKEYSKI